ncbi:CubicO group peptidase (beta-lactamase class C family) [Pedobacter sp. UYP30]|uniref:serine hydrolase n=1 Tax=Pedobacter sp. UYP30 TaxID=1756400 RepID=UPI003395FAC3
MENQFTKTPSDMQISQRKCLLNDSSIFELASVSKQFTAMAIMQLHQAEKLKYEDDIRKYLYNIPLSLAKLKRRFIRNLN